MRGMQHMLVRMLLSYQPQPTQAHTNPSDSVKLAIFAPNVTISVFTIRAHRHIIRECLHPFVTALAIESVSSALPLA